MDRVRGEVRRSGLSDDHTASDARPVVDVGRTDEARPAPGRKSGQGSALGLAEIMRRLHDELERRRRAVNSAEQPRPAQAARSRHAGKLPRWISPTARLNKREYVLHELLQYSDADFVDTAYLTLLRRPADVAERERFLTALRSGQLDKVEVLGKIRFSEEGRRQSVHVDGLLLPYKLHQWRRVRGIGRVLAFAMAIVKLPRMVMHLQVLDNAVAMHSQNHGQLINRIDDALEAQFSEIDKEFGSVRAELLQTTEVRAATLNKIADELQMHRAELAAYRADNVRNAEAIAKLIEAQATAVSMVERELHAYQADRAAYEGSLQQRLSTHETSVSRLNDALQLHKSEQDQHNHASRQRMDVLDSVRANLEGEITHNRRSILDIQRRLMMFLDRAAAMTPEVGQRFPTDGDQEVNSILNASYVSFEDRFRGEREDIKARAAPYLDALSSAGIDPAKGVVLDLGCGRGEWLELLAEHGYPCCGVDQNSAMLEESRASGLDVVEADVIDYLRGLKDDSLAAITSMHLVEHLPHNVLIRLLDEAMRVLQPGGMLILETPNPENLTVGACWFYLDPTHRNPIPPDLLQWTVQERGFSQAVVRRLAEHRRVSDIQPVSESVPGAEQINLMAAWFTAAPDYAVIARKP